MSASKKRVPKFTGKMCSKTFEGNWNTGDDKVREAALKGINALFPGTIFAITEAYKSGVYSAHPGAKRHDSYLVITIYWRE